MRLYIYSMMVIILATFGYVWVLLLWEPPLTVTIWPGVQRVWPAASLPFVGAGTALVATAPFWIAGLFPHRPDSDDEPRLPRAISFTLVLAAWGMVVLLCTGVARGAVDPVRAALVLACATATLVTAAYALAAMRRGDQIGMNSHWGGLGGGLGGWRISAPTATILLALVFLGATLAVVPRTGEVSNKQDANEADANNSITANEVDANASAAPVNGAAEGNAQATVNAQGAGAANETAVNGAAGPR